MSTQQQTLLKGLTEVFGEDHVLQVDDVSSRANHIWNAEPLVAMAIIRPANTEQISRVLALCHANRQSVVTHDRLTGSDLLNRGRIVDAC